MAFAVIVVMMMMRMMMTVMMMMMMRMMRMMMMMMMMMKLMTKTEMMHERLILYLLHTSLVTNQKPTQPSPKNRGTLKD